MTDKLKPTAEQIQRACDMANRGRSRALWFPASYGSYTMLTYIADTLARAEKAEADLRRVDEIVMNYPADRTRLTISSIVAPYRVKTDPLVAEAMALTKAHGWAYDGNDLPLVRFAHAALKRGLEIGRSA